MKIRRTDELYELIEKAIDEAFVSKRFLFSMYGYLKGAQYTRKETTAFIESGTANTLNETILDLDAYIKGGDKVLREAYGHIPKPKARKVKAYLYGILEDAWKYHAERKPGRKPGSKNKKKRTK